MEPAPADGGSAGGGEGTEDGESDRDVVVTASLFLSDQSPLEVADAAQAIAEDAGGRVDARTDTPSRASGAPWSELVIRVPSAELDATMRALSGIATVVESSIDRRDVTGTMTDVTARIGALDASIDRLLDLLAEAESTADLITIESELTMRQAERDSLAAEQEDLAESVAFSTISVSVGVPSVVERSGPRDFWEGLGAGFASLGAFLTGAVIVLGVLLPWLLVLAVVGALVWWGLRARAARPRRSGDRGPGSRGPGNHGSGSHGPGNQGPGNRGPGSPAGGGTPSGSPATSGTPFAPAQPPAPRSVAPARSATSAVAPPRPPLPGHDRADDATATTAAPAPAAERDVAADEPEPTEASGAAAAAPGPASAPPEGTATRATKPRSPRAAPAKKPTSATRPATPSSTAKKKKETE